MKILVTITIADVMTEVRKQAAYVADKVGANVAQTEAITMLLEQNEAIETAVQKGIDEVSLIAGEYLVETTSTGETTTLRLEMPDNYASEQTTQLQDLYTQAVEHTALKAWFDICYPTFSEIVKGKAESDFTELQHMLSRRRRPSKYRLPEAGSLTNVEVSYE